MVSILQVERKAVEDWVIISCFGSEVSYAFAESEVQKLHLLVDCLRLSLVKDIRLRNIVIGNRFRCNMNWRIATFEQV